MRGEIPVSFRRCLIGLALALSFLVGVDAIHGRSLLVGLLQPDSIIKRC